MTTQVEEFLDALHEVDRDTHRLVNQAILVLERSGPVEGRPLVDTITASQITNMKELRPPYRQAIPEAEQLYATYLKEREGEIGDGRR